VPAGCGYLTEVEWVDGAEVTDASWLVVGEELSCSICLCVMEDSQEAKLLPCHHMFHVPCIQTWLNKVFLKRIIQFIFHCHSSLEPAHEKPVPVVGRGRCLEQVEVQNCCSHVVLSAKVWHVIHSLCEIYSILCLRKNDTVDLNACCNSAIHQPILIAFGRVVAE